MAKKKVARTAMGKTSRKSAPKAKTITKEIAQRYLKDTSSVDLDTFTELDDKAAEVLCKSDGWLQLSGLTHLSDAAAKGLAKFKGVSLELNGLTEVSDSVAQFLARVSSCLELSGLTSLTDGLARILASHSDRLKLNGVASLSDKAARHLSSRKAGRLELGGVKSLSDTAATLLASCKDDLELGVDTLSDSSAKHFALFASKLRLSRLRTLSGVAAKHLEKLDDDGRLEVSDRLCKTMNQLKEHCYSWHPLRYRGWALDEKKVKWEEVPDKPRQVLEDAFGYGLNLQKVKITRLTLTAPKGGEKHEYFAGVFQSNDIDMAWWYVVNDQKVVAEYERD